MEVIRVSVYREERLEAEHPFEAPLPAGELCHWLCREHGPGILSNAVTGSRYIDSDVLHGGTFYFNCQKKQPEQPGERLGYFRAVYPRIQRMSPSTIAKSASRFIRVEQLGLPVFYNYRPDTADGLPLPLVSPIFGTFMDKCSGRTPADVSLRDCGFVYELCEKSSTSYNSEAARSDMLIDILQSYFPQYTIQKVNNIDVAVYHKSFLLALIVLKNEEGQGGNSYLQVCRYFAQSAYDCQKDNTLLGSCFPKLLLEIAGPLLKVSGAVFTQAPAIEPLAMAYLIRKAQIDHMDNLCRMVVSLRDTLRNLACFYDQVSAQRVILGVQHVMLPHALQAMFSAGVTFETLSAGESYVASLEGYRGEDKILTGLKARGVLEIFIKFSQRYGGAVHRDWFARGCAPELFDILELPGAWLMILMEYKRGYVNLDGAAKSLQFSVDKWTKVCTLAQQCLQKAQDSKLKGVHGDLRLPNLLVDQGCNQVLVVDFGWAGLEDEDRYPLFMNHDIQWPPGASEDSLMKQEHDRQLLCSQLSKILTRSYDWKSDPLL